MRDPTSADAPAVAAARGIEVQSKTDTAIIADAPCLDKAIKTLEAQAAMAGCTLHQLASGGFLLSRWNLSRELQDTRAVAELLRQMGVRP